MQSTPKQRQPKQPTDPLAALAERSGSPRPWLFYRDGIDWQWLSYRQTAVRVARTADALRQAPRTRGAVPIRPDFDIETLVVRMAARLVAKDAGSGSGTGGVELRDAATDDPRAFVPPPAPKHFETVEAPVLPPASVPFGDLDHARSLFETIRPERGDGSGYESGRAGRPVVFAAPESGVLESLASVSLALDAGWALEPMPEAFVATARWVRPTILVAPPQALDALAEAWDDHDGKWSRLEAVVVHATDERPVPEGRVEHWSKVFGCRVGVWSI